MPIGYAKALEPLVDLLLSTRPSSILDVGIGFGLNGAVARNYLEAGGRIDRNNPAFTLHGIEIFRQYRNPMWKLYDRVTIGDIKDSVDILPNYDLVICTDVLEHLDRQLGLRVLQAPRHAFFGVCNHMEANPRGGVFGNPNEEHVSRWRVDELKNMGYHVTELNPLYLLAVR